MKQGSTATLPMDNTQADPGVRDVALVPAESANLVLMFERLAKDPTVDPDKLEKLITLQEHIRAMNAEAMFWDELAEMQGKLPTIDEDGRILVNDKVRSRYSTNENLQETLRPILAEHGFALSFRNRVTEKGARIVKGILAHRAGHKEFDEFESAPDDGGSMNSIQRIGSQRSYGQRYCTIALLNIVSRAKNDRDDDGKNAGKADMPEPPEGFEAWIDHLKACAAKGLKSFEPAWETSDAALKNYAIKWHRESVNALKRQAADASKGRP